MGTLIIETQTVTKSLIWTGIFLLQMTIAGLFLTLGWGTAFIVVLSAVISVVSAKRPEWVLYILIFLVVIFWNTIGVTLSSRNLLSKTIPVYAPFLFMGLFCIGMRIASRIQCPVHHGRYLSLPILILYTYSFFTITWYTDLAYSLFTFAFFTVNIFLFHQLYGKDLQKRYVVLGCHRDDYIDNDCIFYCVSSPV